jgi:hypothetical protein
MASWLNTLPDDVYRLVYSFLRPDITYDWWAHCPIALVIGPGSRWLRDHNAALPARRRLPDTIYIFEQIELRSRNLARKYCYTLDAARRQNSPYLTVPTLKAHCKENGIKRYTKMNRKELIQALMKM